MGELEDENNIENKPRKMLGFRHWQVFMLFLSMMILLSMKVTISIAIVAMTDSTQNNTFDWSHQTQSIILSSFKWGYIILKIPGGEVAARYGGMGVLIWCMTVNALASTLLPIASYYGGWMSVCACRLVQGLAQGAHFPVIHNLIGKWIPIEEKGRLATFIYAGGTLGMAIQLAAAGFIIDAWGWPAIFYINGILGFLWTAIYLFTGSSSPQSSKLISCDERLFIQKSLGQVGLHKRIPTPWRDLFTSLPFIALMLTNAGNGWGYWTLLTEMPTYMKQILNVNTKQNGVMSAIPYLGNFILSFFFGFMSDYILKKKYLSITASRKLSNSIASFGPACFLITLSYISTDVTGAVILLTAAVSINAGYFTGYNLVHLDMAPNHAGTMMGITSGFSNVISLGAPLSAGFLIKDETESKEWRKVFFLAAGMYIVTNTFYLIFGTSKRQIWNEPKQRNSPLSAENHTEKNV